MSTTKKQGQAAGDDDRLSGAGRRGAGEKGGKPSSRRRSGPAAFRVRLREADKILIDVFILCALLIDGLALMKWLMRPLLGSD